MPHEIEQHDTMVSSGGVVPWHRLGTVVENLPYDDVLRLAGLDWEVELVPVYACIPQAGQQYDPELPMQLIADGGRLLPGNAQRAVVRRELGRPENDRVISIVGSDYVAVQNAHGLEFLRILMDAGDIQVETAGSLRNNRIVWVCARMDRNITIAGDVTVPYLVFSTSHDASMAAGVTAGPVRVVCRNTFAASEVRAVRSWRTRHVGDIRQRVVEARAALEMGTRFYDAFEAEVRNLMAQSVTEQAWSQVRDALIPIDTAAMTDRQVRNREARREAMQVRWIVEDGTAFGALQAVNGFELWDRPVRGGDDPVGARAARQAWSVLRGRQPMTDQAHAMLIGSR